MSKEIEIADLGDTLCEFCTWNDESWNDQCHSAYSNCGNAFCENALENYNDYINNLEE